MSKNRCVLDALKILILILDDMGVIDVHELIEELGVVETSVVVAKKNSRYEEVAEYLKKGMSVFIEGGRQRMHYAKKRLNELGIQVRYTKAIYEGKIGYLITPANPETSQ